jgi:hypothetical protein
MATSPIELLYLIEKLAPPVLKLIGEVIGAVKESKTERDAARAIGLIAARKILLG